jgi:hypothetical protein
VLDGWNVGIEVTGEGHVTVVDTIIRNSGSSQFASAIHIDHANAVAMIDNVRAIDGGNNGFGVTAGKATVRNSLAAGNINLGAFVSGVSAELTIEKSALVNSSDGAVSFQGILRVSDSVVTGNALGLFSAGGTLESFGNNAVRGNGANTSGPITPVVLQ